MARKTELTQELIDQTADELHSKGVKPSPNSLREILGKGSYSTIKQMLDQWKEKQEEEQAIFIPETPEFAYQLVDKLHKELYLQNKKSLESERQQLDAAYQEIEVDKKEMMAEINQLEAKSLAQEIEIGKKEQLIQEYEAALKKIQTEQLEKTELINQQKIELATLTEREIQHTLQLKEAEQRNTSLIQQLEQWMEKIKV